MTADKKSGQKQIFQLKILKSWKNEEKNKKENNQNQGVPKESKLFKQISFKTNQLKLL